MFDPESRLIEVKDFKTKEYLKEVISSYYNNNYRACIVTLYTTVVSDLLNKIIKCTEYYNDTNAVKKLKEIEEMQKKDCKYSEIEAKIFESIKELGYLNTIEISQFHQLKEARNNAAHPVFKHNYDLISPTKEQCIAHIRNMYESIFSKDIILSKKILNDFREDICQYYDRQPELVGFEKYFMSKYYSKFNDTSKKFIFKEIWKNAFYFNDTDCLKNRKVLIKTLNLLLEWDKPFFLNQVQENPLLYTKIDFQNLGHINDEVDLHDLGSTSLLILLANHNELWIHMPEDIKVEIENMILKNTYIAMRMDFIYDSEEMYLSKIVSSVLNQPHRKPCLKPKLLLEKYKQYKEAIGSEIRYKLADYYYRNTDSVAYINDFDYINAIYIDVIRHVLDDYSEDELKYLLNKVNTESYRNANTRSEFKKQVIGLIERNQYSIDLDKYWRLLD